jgi:hypothetical protein
MQLNQNDNSGGVEGTITWRLEATNRTGRLNRIGDTAVEYVRGAFNPNTFELTLQGYRVSDSTLIAIDKYRISLSRNGQSFTGRSETNEKNWEATMSANRQDR